MNLTLTLGTGLSLSIISTSIGTVAQKPTEDPTEAQNQKDIEICTKNLTAIGKAVQAYHNEKGDFPLWLSELYPEYLSDANLLRCPADEEDGKSAYAINEDPQMSVSYGYQFHPKYREMKTEQRKVYGDAIPLVRCRHHENQPFECLNLSFGFKVYTSSGIYHIRRDIRNHRRSHHHIGSRTSATAK